jgi:BirA family transcriptional regulator, biotin operon repressor / biotin---[acetyl-CoA-carboxylase] ligase
MSFYFIIILVAMLAWEQRLRIGLTMVDDSKRMNILEKLPLGAWQYYPVVGSTNDLALAWAKAGAPDWSLVLADAQTAGRGRSGRGWVTLPDSALAMSLVLRATPEEAADISRFTALAALGLIRALGGLGLQAQLKWPNDVFLAGKKVAGVLVEADWQGNHLAALVVGMGVNVGAASVPEAAQLKYPATSVADVYGAPVDRWALLGEIIREMVALRQRLTAESFTSDWNSALAFRGEWVYFRQPGAEPERIKILGVGSSGELNYETPERQQDRALAGEILMAYN